MRKARFSEILKPVVETVNFCAQKAADEGMEVEEMLSSMSISIASSFYFYLYKLGVTVENDTEFHNLDEIVRKADILISHYREQGEMNG